MQRRERRERIAERRHFGQRVWQRP
jgi:hypothetical protein